MVLMQKIKCWRMRASGVLVAAIASLMTASTAWAAGGGGDGLSITPNTSLPGTSETQSLVGGLMTYALVASFGALVFSAGAWAYGHHSHNPSVQTRGKSGTVVAALAALLIGAAGAIIQKGYTAGQGF
jgi:hypothetical protein